MSNYDNYKRESQGYKKYSPYDAPTLSEPTIVRQPQKVNRYSDLLPKAVLVTLNSKEAIIQNFKAKCEVDKKRIEEDFDALLRDLILVFEDFKMQLFSKIDEHHISFSNFVNQLDGLAIECSHWAEERIQQADITADMKATIDDTLYKQLSEVRINKQKADETEKALIAIKQKIEQMRLNELNNDIMFLADERSPSIYLRHEANRVNDSIKADLRNKINAADQTKFIKSFMMDTKVVNKPDNKVYKISVPQSQESNVFENAKIESVLSVTPDMETNKNVMKPVAERKDIRVPVLAQQNHFISDQIDLLNPYINLENEVYVKNPAKLTAIIALNKKSVLVGNEDGNFIIMDIMNSQTNNPGNQMLVNAHNAPIKVLSKINNNLLLSSAISPDNSLKLWDLSSLIGEGDQKPTKDSEQPKSSIMLLSVLKGHTDTIVGSGFISDRIVISASKDGIINVWDWKLSTPMASFKAQNGSITNFMLLSNKDGFVLSMNSGSIVSYSLNKTTNGYEFVKTGELNETSPVIGLNSFRGNNDLIIVTLLTGEVKLISRRSGQSLNTIQGCKNPYSFFIMTCVKANPDVFLMALESYGFKIADVDQSEFKAVNTRAMLSFRCEKLGEPCWQIIDCVGSKKILFATINHATKPNAVLLWSLQKTE